MGDLTPIFLYEWDASSRLVSKTLPNGIRQELIHDDADRLLSLSYKKADGSSIETIAYTYDAKGQRLSKTMSGSSTRETPFTASYDAANRMSAITLTASNQSFTLAYDDNGNLISKTDNANAANTTTYSWDSRNRLTGINAPGMTASFKYDALGRRSEKSVNGQSVNYIYDGAQAIGEVTNGAVSAAILTGLNIDEVLARYASSGNRSMLTDALGSVIAQANDSGAVENYYSYSPYGETITLGPDATNNSIQYTGRENDQTGLYYYRARYYDPVLKRFISADPIGLAGGINEYSYVHGNPISYTDPMGLDVRVSLYHGAGGAGHVGISVVTGEGGTGTVGFYPATPPSSPFQWVPGVVLRDDPSKQQGTLVIKTTSQKDACVAKCINDRTENPGSYQLKGRQCRDFVLDCLTSCGIKASGPQAPWGFFNDLRREHQR